MTKSSKKRNVPLAPPPLKSRKKARKVTSLFHKLTQQMDRAKAKNDVKAITRLVGEIDEMGGREEYQRASQLSTKFHSTSKWVLKVLGNKGWTNGIPAPLIDQDSNGNDNDTDTDNHGHDNDHDHDHDHDNGVQENAKETKKNLINRTVQILEVGAINTELVDAAKRTKRVRKKKEKTSSSSTSTCTSSIHRSSSNGSDEKDAMTLSPLSQQYQNVSLYNINIRAIDLRSTFADIEEKDFLQMPVENETSGTYDVIVCSMVLNCVTTPEDRGLMLSLLYKQLRPGGLCFFTMPRLCINQSKFIDRKLFEELLTDALGFEIDSQKETPKVAFWILKRPKDEAKKMVKWNKKWEATPIIHRAQKFRNLFGVSLKKDHVYGRKKRL